jgi:hypothetical protein
MWSNQCHNFPFPTQWHLEPDPYTRINEVLADGDEVEVHLQVCRTMKKIQHLEDFETHALANIPQQDVKLDDVNAPHVGDWAKQAFYTSDPLRLR